jgi:hypothetical protein
MLNRSVGAGKVLLCSLHVQRLPALHCPGDQIISQQLSFGERQYWEGVVALIGLTAALNLLAYWMLRR